MLRKSQKSSLDALEWQVLKKTYSEVLYQDENVNQLILDDIKQRCCNDSNTYNALNDSFRKTQNKDIEEDDEILPSYV